jgi:hypothetical protein
MVQALSQLALTLGMSPQMLILLVIVGVWDGVWKLFSMWKAAQKKSIAWFIILAIFNTAGILPILYIYVFSRIKLKEKKNSSKVSKKKKR